MASAPVFASAPRIGVGSVTVTNTNRDGTGTLVDILTGVAAGTRIERIAAQSTNDPADCTVTLFLWDGATNWLWNEMDFGNPAAASATVVAYRAEMSCADLVLPNASWKLKAAVTAAPTAGAINVFAFGADLT